MEGTKTKGKGIAKRLRHSTSVLAIRDGSEAQNNSTYFEVSADSSAKAAAMLVMWTAAAIVADNRFQIC